MHLLVRERSTSMQGCLNASGEKDCLKASIRQTNSLQSEAIFIMVPDTRRVLKQQNKHPQSMYMFNRCVTAKGDVYLKMLRLNTSSRKAFCSSALIGARSFSFTSRRKREGGERGMKFTESRDTDFSFWHLMQVPWLHGEQWITG